MNVRQSKLYLIETIIFRLTVHGAFQRNSIYSKTPNKKENKEFKDYLKRQLANRLKTILGKSSYSDKNHYHSIMTLSKSVSGKFPSLLKNREFNIGTAQKLLNLYWKLNWLLKKRVPSPIHCPFDGIIIGKLSSDVKHIKWTQMNDIEQYKILVAAAKKKSLGKNLGQWELKTYNQSNFMT